MHINIRVLGSSSAGNCTLVWDRATAVMIDCGFGPRHIRRSLKDLGLNLASLSGVLVTHSHRDHIHFSTLRALFEARVPVFCPADVVKVLERDSATILEATGASLLHPIDSHMLGVGGFRVTHFQVPHDSPGGCFGYTLTSTLGRRKITIATDMGYPPLGLAEHFVDSDVIIIESNHDRDMLQNSRRPVWLKKRITEIGHLSNDQCAAFVMDVMRQSYQLPQAIVLAHISRTCNTRALAENCTREALRRLGHDHVAVIPTHWMRPTDIMSTE